MPKRFHVTYSFEIADESGNITTKKFDKNFATKALAEQFYTEISKKLDAAAQAKFLGPNGEIKTYKDYYKKKKDESEEDK